MLRLEKIGDAIKRLVIDEDRAEQRLLGLDIVRRHAERGFRGSLLACGRIECCHGPDQGIPRVANLEVSVLNIADHSTTAARWRIRNRCATTNAPVDSRAAARWEILIAAFPVTHRTLDRAERKPQRSLLTRGFSGAATAPRYSPASRSGCRIAGFGGAQPRFFARDVVAGLPARRPCAWSSGSGTPPCRFRETPFPSRPR